jgi:hypothetical protein
MLSVFVRRDVNVAFEHNAEVIGRGKSALFGDRVQGFGGVAK